MSPLSTDGPSLRGSAGGAPPPNQPPPPDGDPPLNAGHPGPFPGGHPPDRWLAGRKDGVGTVGIGGVAWDHPAPVRRPLGMGSGDDEAPRSPTVYSGRAAAP